MAEKESAPRNRKYQEPGSVFDAAETIIVPTTIRTNVVVRNGSVYYLKAYQLYSEGRGIGEGYPVGAQEGIDEFRIGTFMKLDQLAVFAMMRRCTGESTLDATLFYKNDNRFKKKIQDGLDRLAPGMPLPDIITECREPYVAIETESEQIQEIAIKMLRKLCVQRSSVIRELDMTPRWGQLPFADEVPMLSCDDGDTTWVRVKEL